MERQRETELYFRRSLIRAQNLEFYINSLLKGQDIDRIYVVIDVRVSKEIFQIINRALKRSEYKDKIRYCFKENVYIHRSKNSLYILLFESKRLMQFLYLRKKMFLTLKNLCVTYDRDDLLRIEIPPIFNSMENCFKKIGIYYTHSFGKKIFLYLQKNTNISVSCINKELTVEKGRYLLQKQNYDIIIFLDLIESKKVYNSFTGKEYLCLFWKDIINRKNMNYMFDVTEQIIPWLIEKKVKIVIANGVNLQASQNRYINKAIEKSNARDRGAKYRSLKESCLLNGKFIEDEKLGKLWFETKLDLSKGYLRRFHTGDSYNFADGFRIVYNISRDEKKNNIYLFGSCISCSAWARDEDTLCNQLVRIVGKNYNVYSKTNNIENMNLVMRECMFKENDIVLLFFDELTKYKKSKEIHTFDMDRSLRLIPDLGKHMLDGMWQHLDKEAIKILAEELIYFLMDHELLNIKSLGENKKDVCIYTMSHYKKRPMSWEMYGDRELGKWIKKISLLKKENGINGAIVMNCNPMTLGHLYLIQQAQKYVDNLYIFIVEENSSEFSFDDRFSIVCNNLKGMQNLIVLPSGKYILSAGTLEGYFTKKDFEGMSIDASEDLELFLTIAQYLNITYRFVGSEPKDRFTKLYNEAMKEKLPQYGVEVVEIKRLQIDNNFVSASDVRKYIALNDWDSVRKIVPPYTFNYLRTVFVSNNNGKSECGE